MQTIKTGGRNLKLYALLPTPANNQTGTVQGPEKLLDAWERRAGMYRTIAIGSSVLMQGQPEKTTPEGRLVIRIGDRRYQGWPVDAPLMKVKNAVCVHHIE